MQRFAGMAQLGFRSSPLLAAAGLALFFLAACGDVSPSYIIEQECIGPEGETYELTDPEDFAYGVRVKVLPGDWQDCWSLQLNGSFDFFLPDGFHARGPATFYIEQFGDVPDGVQLEMSLPVAGAHPPVPGSVLAAFWQDEDADTWRIVAPAEFVDGRMIVRTTKKTSEFREQWSWGTIALLEADFEESLAPLMVEAYGLEEWARRTTN